MTQVLKGKPVADQLKSELKDRIDKLKSEGINPKLTVLRVGERSDDISYEKGIVKNCENLGIETNLVNLPADSATEDLIDLIEKANEDDSIHGIMLFRPLPKQMDELKVLASINPKKDVDSMTSHNLGKVFEGDFSGNIPATPAAAIAMLKYYGVELEGANVAVINRSTVFGRPFAMMALGENATPIICHSRTKNLEEITKKADVVVTAQGRPKALGKEYFTEDSIIIDVGMSDDDEGNLVGDADFENLDGFVKMITPTLGGVGAITSTILLEQVVKSAETKLD